MKKKISERTLTSKQQVTQMNHYWKDLDHMASDAMKKKNMDMRFGIKDIKLDRYGNIISFNKYKRGQFEQQESKIEGFSQFLEAKDNTVVFSFGRFNPPSIGHQKLIQAIIKKAKGLGAKPKLYISYSHDTKKNPLTAKQKISYIRKMFPKEIRQIDLKDNSSIKTILDVLVKLHGDYDKIVMIVGSDRVAEFKKLLNKYNGIDSTHGFYKYKDIQVVNAGKRDPDAEGATGMSASKMRAAAVSGDYDSFALGLPDTYKYGKKLYKDVRNAMGVTEELKPFKPVSEMNNIEFIREQYFQNLIYNIGDWVKDTKTGITGEVVKRGTNYITLVQEDFTLHKVWLEDIKAIEQQHKKLPEAINFLKNRNLWEKVQREKVFSRKEAGEKEDSHKKEWGTNALTKRSKKITPGQTVKESKVDLKKFASKFKIPTNVAQAIWHKLAAAGIDPLEIQKYSVLLTTYINLMDEKLPEVAPPGREKQILKLKKKFGKDSDIPYKIAWAQYKNKG